jgi:hypothetical protein
LVAARHSLQSKRVFIHWTTDNWRNTQVAPPPELCVQRQFCLEDHAVIVIRRPDRTKLPESRKLSSNLRNL